jgi:branched-chain amino acid transport system ATP-binding protein
MSAALSIEHLVAGYGATVVIDDVSLSVPAGGTLAILGRNGVGKTTLLQTLMGLTTLHRGAVRLGDERIDGLPTHHRARLGLGYVPQEREIFPSLTTEENLAVSAQSGGWTIEAVLDLFPSLKERSHTTGNRLSGGEQQMLAIGRALVGGPKVLLLDEPLEGLAPIIVEELTAAIRRMTADQGTAFILVEQHAEVALSLTEQAIVLERGAIVHRARSQELLDDHATLDRLIGLRLAEQA